MKPLAEIKIEVDDRATLIRAAETIHYRLMGALRMAHAHASRLIGGATIL